MIKFYADENFHIDFVRQLQQLGYDDLTCFECGRANQSIPDSDVLAFAISQNHILQLLCYKFSLQKINRKARFNKRAVRRSPICRLG